MPPSLDLAFVRSQFPAFSEPGLRNTLFFDSAAGSYACQQVIEHLDDYYREHKMQPYGCHPASRLGGEQMDTSYARLAEYLNVAPAEVHMGPSTSQNTYVLAQAFGKILAPGAEIIVTNQDHEANSGVWRALAQRGMVIKEWQVDPASGELSLEQLPALFTDKTALLAFAHCSNIVGHINPVGAICALAREHQVTTVVDGVSYAGHGLPDIQALGCDLYLFSLYKTFGPHQGVMVVREALAERLGNQGHYFNSEQRHKWFVPAGPDHAQVAASRGVAEYFDALHAHHYGADADTARRPAQVSQLLRSAELQCLPMLLDFIGHHPRAQLIGPADTQRHSATVALHLPQQSPAQVAKVLAGQGVIVGAGHFYAVRLLEALGIDPAKGVLRLSFSHYNGTQEMERLLSLLDQALLGGQA